MSAEFTGGLRLYTADQVRQMDALAISAEGIPGLELMQRAGAAAWDALAANWPEAGHIIVVCGAGNNAGDGYVIARLAAEAGRRVSILALTAPDRLTGDAAVCARRAIERRIFIDEFTDSALADADVIVDALLGTGLDREVSGHWLHAIHAINHAGVPVLAVDIPSGLHADTGLAMGAAVQASMTITFIGAKLGLYAGEGANYRGRVIHDDLAVPRSVLDRFDPVATVVTLDDGVDLLRPRLRTGHKGNYGHVLVVGGEHGYAGAARLCAGAAARSGAGLVSVATRREHAGNYAMTMPELMASAVESAAELGPLIDRADVIAVGPGLGQTAWSKAMLARVLDTTGKALVVDADALNLLAAEPQRRDDQVLTPHPGEAARLLGCAVATVQSDRLAAATALAERYGGVVILKGAGTVVRDRSGRCWICGEGNPGMASGGMGDVLSGIIAGLLAQGYTLDTAALLAVCVHARAADREAAGGGERGMLASDLYPWIRRLLNP